MCSYDGVTEEEGEGEEEEDRYTPKGTGVGSLSHGMNEIESAPHL